MPIQVVWDNEAKTVIRQIYSGNVSLQDYMTAADDVERLAKMVPHTVHSIMDRGQIQSTPSMVLRALRYANNHVPPNLGLRVIINGDVFTRVVVDIGRQIAPRLIRDIYFVDTLDAARDVITRHGVADMAKDQVG